MDIRDKGAEPGSDLAPVRILIADDSADIREALTEVLTWMGNHEVVATASNGREACELCELHRPQVVVMDVNMPVMDGIEAMRIMRERWPEVPVIMYTAGSAEAVARESYQAGAFRFLAKPVGAEEILLAIQQAARNSPTI